MLVMVRLGRTGVGVIVGVLVAVGVIPGRLVSDGCGVGCAILVWVAKIAVEDRSPADGPCGCCLKGVKVNVGRTTTGIVLLGVGGS